MFAARRYSAIVENAVTRPVEFLDRIAGDLERRRSRHVLVPNLPATHSDHVAAAHEIVLAPACDDCSRTLSEVKASVASRLAGFNSFDAGTALAETLWVLVRHLRPRHVIETGVARGVSSAFTLDALARNGVGSLWSIDLPPLGGDWADQIGIAVAPDVRDRWAYLRGASHRILPSLLAELGSVGIFTHDGLHTRKTQEFEYRTVWPFLRDGGILVSDDVNSSDAFASFAKDIAQGPILISEHAKDGLIGLLRRQQVEPDVRPGMAAITP